MTRFLHVAVIDKFLPGFVEFMGARFKDFDEAHRLLVLGTDETYPLPARPNIQVLHGRSRHLQLWQTMREARRVFLHGLFDPAVTRVLAIDRRLLRKCWWLIWGGELYDEPVSGDGLVRDIDDWSRRVVIRHVANLITHIPGDIDHARSTFGATGRAHECLLYPSNVFAPTRSTATRTDKLRVLVGNSATATNRHLELFERLKLIRLGEHVELIAPLSYGDASYARTVEDRGIELFGNRFTALRRFMPPQEYQALLQTVDIALFNHGRQQAAGNIVQLLGYGKKVFLHPEVSTWRSLQARGIVAYDVRDIDLSPIDTQVAEANMRCVEQHYSAEALERQWRQLTSEPEGELR